MRTIVRLVAVAFATVPLFTACSEDAPEGFGPSAYVDAEHEPAMSDAPLVPKIFEAAPVREKALDVRQTRVDVGDPLVENWEVAIEVARADPASADGDEVYAVWMTGRESASSVTTTRLRAVRSADGARTFVELPLEIPASAQPIQIDPTVEFDRIDNKAYIAAMGQTSHTGRNFWLATGVGNDATAFAPGVAVPAGTLPDKPWLASGPRPGDATRSVLYFADRDGIRASTDRGATWSSIVHPFGGGNLLQPEVFPDGTLAATVFGAQALFARSTDMGRTFAARRAIHTFAGDMTELITSGLPGSFRAAPAAMFARSPVDGRLYAVVYDVVRRDARGADLDVLLFTSDDNGNTWSAGRALAGDTFIDQFIPTIGVDAAGRVHIAYLESRTADGSDTASAGRVDVWYAVSTDRGASFTSQKLTSAPIPTEVTRWSPLGNAPDAQFVGDYISLAVSQRAVYVAHPVFEANTVGMTVSRIALDAAATTAIRDPRGLTGPWYEPASAGQGFEFHWITGDRLLVFFYGFHDDGSNFFVSGVREGRFDYGQSFDVPLVAATGGRYNGLDPAAIRRPAWGTVRVRFDSCTAANARLDGTDGVKELRLERLTLAPNLPCD